MRNPKISIVTPSYNQGAYIEKTIKSIISQDYDNLEYIIVDGQSSDNTLKILKKYNRHPRIKKIIIEKDNGQIDALIKGFKLCTGKILGWINSDDLLAPRALASIGKHFNACPNTDVLVGKLELINSRGEHLKIQKRKEMQKKDWLRTTMLIQQPCTFFTSKAYHAVGGLDSTLEYSMDYDLFIKLALRNSRFFFTDQILASFRLHDTSKTVALPWKQLKESTRVFRRYNRNPLAPFYYCQVKGVVIWLIKHRLLGGYR